jgi:hypothetical protein
MRAAQSLLAAVVGLAALSSCRRSDPEAQARVIAAAAASPGVPVADPSLPAGVLVVDLVAAVPPLAIDKPTAVLVRSARRSWTPEAPAYFKGLPATGSLDLSVSEPYVAEPLSFTFPGPGQGARIALKVVPVVPWTPPRAWDERYTPEKVLEIDLTRQDTIGLRWEYGRVTVSTLERPRGAPDLAATFKSEWNMQGSHRDPVDRRVDQAFIRVEPGAPLASFAPVLAALLENRRAQTSPDGLITIPLFNVTITTPPPPVKLVLDDEIAPLDVVASAPDHGPSIAGAVEPMRDAVIRCGVAACSPRLYATLLLHLGEALAVAGKSDTAEQAFFEARAVDPLIVLDPAATAGSAKIFAAAWKRRMPGVRTGALAVSGRLDAEVVRAGVAARAGLVRLCYVRALRGNPKLQGRVSVRFVIGNDGVAPRASNSGSDLADASAVQCIVEALQGLTFPRPEGGIVTVTHPFLLSPDGA